VSTAKPIGVVAKTAIPGGSINQAYRATLADGRTVFYKTHREPKPGMYAAEAAGLAWLQAARSSLVIPQVIAFDESMLALAWLELGSKRPDFGQLGRGLAELHLAGAPTFGLDAPNYLATIPQDNTPRATWPELYIEQRLRPITPRSLFRELDRLRARPDVFGPPEPPARLHGDLWWGNVAALVDGTPVIFDPAVYGGHREIDLAMLGMFGDLPDRMISAYEELAPLADGWRARIPLHQLYPLAAHAAMFGGGYVRQYAASLAQITGNI